MEVDKKVVEAFNLQRRVACHCGCNVFHEQDGGAYYMCYQCGAKFYEKPTAKPKKKR